ncbi:MAG TPA: hypothetical protein VEG33_14670 [Streptosporangiaceae bacterium]|nr:hypothetical protein [Streptosporangiaceae bacterium]
MTAPCTCGPDRSRQAKFGPDLIGGDVLARLFQRLPRGATISEIFHQFPRLAGGHAFQQRGELGRDDRGHAFPVLGELDNMASRRLVRGGAEVRPVIDRQLAHHLRVCRTSLLAHVRLPGRGSI